MKQQNKSKLIFAMVMDGTLLIILFIAPSRVMSQDIGVITYREGAQPQRIYAFVGGADGKLYVNYWNGSRWQWADQGTPPGTTVNGSPGVITYQEAGRQRIYAFIQGDNGKLYVNYWDGLQWRWADQGLFGN